VTPATVIIAFYSTERGQAAVHANGDVTSISTSASKTDIAPP